MIEPITRSNFKADFKGPVLLIRKTALQSALQGAKNLYPDEFIGLFRGETNDKGQTVLTELILAPFSHYEKDSSSYSPYFLPANSQEKASFHSHPDPGTAYPSDEDLHFFGRTGGFHFIACYPFGLKDVNAFDANGRRIEFHVIS